MKDENWKGFAEHLVKAKTHLKKAMAIDPNLPQPATEMITVAMAGHADPKEDVEFWFERAVWAQFDYEPAYDHYLYAILPRWAGSHDDMYAFAQDCVATGRFDTRVPSYFFRTVKRILNDTEHQLDLKRFGNASELATQCADGYITELNGRKGTPPHWIDWYVTEKIAYAMAVGDFASAKKFKGEIRQALQPDPLAVFGRWPEFTASEVDAKTGPFAARIEEARKRQQEGGSGEEVLKLCQNIEADMAKDDPGRPFMHEQIVRMRTKLELDAEKQVLLSPANVDDWIVSAGELKADADGSLIATSRGGLLAIYKGLLPKDYMFSFDVEVISRPEDPEANFSLYPRWCRWSENPLVKLHFQRQEIIGGPEGREYGSRAQKLANEMGIHCQVREELIHTRVDGNQAGLGITTKNIKIDDPARRLAIGGSTKIPDGCVFKITDFKIKKLSPMAN